VNDIKTGALVGVDKYGNKYYEDNKNFFGINLHTLVVYKFKFTVFYVFWVCIFHCFNSRPSPMGDLHHRDERKEDFVGCWR